MKAVLWPFAFALLTLSITGAQATVTLGVDSPAVRFSPGNWAGDSGRGGTVSRNTWVPGAWCEWRWTTPAAAPAATLQICDPGAGRISGQPSRIAYFLDGALTEGVNVPSQGGIPLHGLTGPGEHTLLVITSFSDQITRWSQDNRYIVTGLTVDDGAMPLPNSAPRPWVMFVGDSTTEGAGPDNTLLTYAFYVSEGLRAWGYDTDVSACGSNGWISKGDINGDVPGYYSVVNGVYSEKDSRWDKIDATTSLLDAQGHVSGWGGPSQEPAAIVTNIMVNEALRGISPHDAQLSVTGWLADMRSAAPNTWLIVMIPPGLQDTTVYPNGAAYVAALRDGVHSYLKAHPRDKRTLLLDLGVNVAHALASPDYSWGVHWKQTGHAYLAPLVLSNLLRIIGNPQELVHAGS